MSSTKVQEIESAISKLTSHEWEELSAWFDSRPDPFDLRIQSDLSAGRLDDAIQRALDEEQNGHVEPL